MTNAANGFSTNGCHRNRNASCYDGIRKKRGNCLQLGYVSANHSPVLISSTNSVFVFTHYVSVVCSLYYLFCLFVPKNYSMTTSLFFVRFVSFCCILFKTIQHITFARSSQNQVLTVSLFILPMLFILKIFI